MTAFDSNTYLFQICFLLQKVVEKEKLLVGSTKSAKVVKNITMMLFIHYSSVYIYDVEGDNDHYNNITIILVTLMV